MPLSTDRRRPRGLRIEVTQGARSRAALAPYCAGSDTCETGIGVMETLFLLGLSICRWHTVIP